MFLSRTSQYAIQALVYLAMQPRSMPVLARDIARSLNVSATYLSKIMQSLSKGMLLSSQRGRKGGFYLREGVEKVGIVEILAHTERVSFTQDCVLGLKACSDVTACPMHCDWKPIKQAIVDLLQRCTLQQLGEDVLSGRYQLADLPNASIAELLPPGVLLCR